MKRIISFALIIVCIFSLSSCFMVPAYDQVELEEILDDCGYRVVDVTEVDHNGVNGYLHATKDDEMLYYIYCKNLRSAGAIYKYISGKLDIEISGIKAEIKEIEFNLEHSDASAAEKGRYYERYVTLTERLEEVQNYGCGRGFNVVWYGTKQAIMDIRIGDMF